jgi:hypothetical protein
MPSATESRDAVSFRRAGAPSVVPRWRSLAEILRPNVVLHTIHASRNVQCQNRKHQPQTGCRHDGSHHNEPTASWRPPRTAPRFSDCANCTQSVCVDGRWNRLRQSLGRRFSATRREARSSRAVRISTSAGEQHDRRDRCRSPQLLRARLHPALASNKAASLKPVMTDQFGDYRQGVRGDTSR